jgi:hypothetical protein
MKDLQSDDTVYYRATLFSWFSSAKQESRTKVVPTVPSVGTSDKRIEALSDEVNPGISA